MPFERRCPQPGRDRLAREMTTALTRRGLVAPTDRVSVCWRPDPDHDVMIVAPGLVWCAAWGGSYSIDASDFETWERCWTGHAPDRGASVLAEVAELLAEQREARRVGEDYGRAMMQAICGDRP